ncbi:MAG TPA: BRCT domain-containing protein [Planctomycetota bacterium]|nr:BRCT domain-containing protein [Planctomycetota bacterium]
MAQREGSVYLYLFIVACVLFMVMAVLFFVDNAEKQTVLQTKSKLDAEINNLKTAHAKLVAEHRNLKIVVAGQTAADSFLDPPTEYLREMKEKVETPINTTLADLKEAPRAYSSLIDHFGDIQQLLSKMRQGRDDAHVARSAAVDTHLKDKASTETALDDLKKKHGTVLQELQDCQSKYEDLDNKSKADNAEMVARMDRERDECSDTIIKLKREVNSEQNKVRTLQIRIDKLEEEVRIEKNIEDIEADGQITTMLSQSGKGWINLGRGDALRNGFVFRVFQFVKGQKKRFKGTVEVSKVGESTSEVRVVEEIDNLDPIVQGDFISSPFYDKKSPPVFAFAGNELESKDVTREFLEARMRSSGALIRDTVDINTDFLVALKNFENTPEYRTARELNIAVIRERDLLEFIGR